MGKYGAAGSLETVVACLTKECRRTEKMPAAYPSCCEAPGAPGSLSDESLPLMSSREPAATQEPDPANGET
eukprot:14792552-Alexandrium_andersonii.AAC.1